MNGSILPQLFINGIIAGAIYGLVALGLALMYGVARFLNFAHGEMTMLGAYLFFTFYVLLGWPIVGAIISAVILAGVAGCIFEKLFFKPVRKAKDIVPLVVSIGLSILLQSMVLLLFGANIKTLRSGVISVGHRFAGFIITDIQIVIIVVALTLMVLLALYLKYSKTGKAIRALADSQDIAQILGINVNQVISHLFFIGSALAGIAGILVGFEQNLEPTMGLSLTIKAFAAIVLGGVTNIYGAVLGAFVIGLAENFGIGLEFFGHSIPSGYKDAIAFFIMIIVLLFRPQGLLGRKKEEESRKE